MNLGTKEIKKALNDPEITYPGGSASRGKYHNPNRTLYCRGRIAVLVCNDTDQVVTILWRGLDEYTRPTTLETLSS